MGVNYFEQLYYVPVEDLLGKIIESRVKWIYCEPEDSHNALDAARKCSWNVHVLVNGTAAECTAIDEVFCYKGQGITTLF